LFPVNLYMKTILKIGLLGKKNLASKIFIYLGGEVLGSAGGLVLRVGGDVSSLDVLDGDILDVEANVVTGTSLGQ
jgi:hypothetical protein